MPEPQPTVETITDAQTYLERFWTPSHTDWKEVDSFIKGTFKVWQLPDGRDDPRARNRREFRPPTARTRATNATAQMLGYSPSIKRREIGRGDTVVTDTSDIENFSGALWRGGISSRTLFAIQAAAWYMVTLGYGVLKLDYNTEELPRKPDRRASDFDKAMEEYEDKRAGINPFEISAPHPATVLLPWDAKKPGVGIETGTWTSGALRKMTEDRAKKVGKARPVLVNVWESSGKPYEEVQCVHYWTEEWHAMMTVSKRLLFVERNSWGFVPFKQGFGGFGHLETDGEQPAPFYLAQGLFPAEMRETIRYQAQGKSARMDALAGIIYPVLFTGVDPVWLAEHLSQDEVVGQEGLKQEDVWYQRPAEMPQYQEAMEGWIDRQIEMGTLSDMFGGEREVGVVTVGQTALLTDLGQRKFLFLATQLEDMASAVLEDCLRIFLKGDEEMELDGFKLKPAQLRGNTNISVKMEQLNPAMRIQHLESMMKAFQMGVISGKTLRESGLLLEDEAEERARLLGERLDQSPMVQAHQDKVTAEEMGQEEVAAQMEEEIRQMEEQGAQGARPSPVEIPQQQGGQNVPQP